MDSSSKNQKKEPLEDIMQNIEEILRSVNNCLETSKNLYHKVVEYINNPNNYDIKDRSAIVTSVLYLSCIVKHIVNKYKAKRQQYTTDSGISTD